MADTEIRDLLQHAADADRENREEAVLDLKFEGFEQWDERDKNLRTQKHLPCITINFVQQYTNMVVGDWLQNDTSIKVLPRENGDTDVAQVRSELMRSVELQSKASRIYASSLGQMVACGISNFRVDVDYAYEDAFDQDIFLRDIPDPLAVYWDPLAFDPTGADAAYCFVADEMTIDEYKAAYPKAALPSVLERDLAGTSWYRRGTVLVPEYWRIDERLRTFGLTVGGKTVDLTDLPRSRWPKLARDIDTKEPIVREKAKCKYAVRVMTNGVEELDDPYELKLSRLPIIRVLGRETRVEGKRIRSGLIRAMRDSQRMKNYARSIRAELLMKAARVNFIASADAVEGREEDYENALVYNAGSQPPVEVTGRNLASLIAEENFYSQDMMDVTGIHEASKGMPSNETSGRAIIARQNEGDTATAIFHAHMVDAQQEAGEVCNQLFDQVFDTTRIIRTVGPDLAVKMVKINDPNDPEAVDLTLGKYDVTISTGPSFQTRRQEAVAQLLDLAQKAPQVIEVGADIIIGEMDLVNGQQLQERVKRAMPPQILGEDANDGKSPEEVAQQAQAAQQAEAEQQAMKQLAFEGTQAETRLKVAQAEKAEADALKSKVEAMTAMGGGSPDPSVAAEEQRTAIMGFDAITKRLGVLSNQKNAPDALESHLAPIIAAAVGQALAKHLGFAPVDLGLPTAPPADNMTANPEDLAA